MEIKTSFNSRIAKILHRGDSYLFVSLPYSIGDYGILLGIQKDGYNISTRENNPYYDELMEDFLVEAGYKKKQELPDIFGTFPSEITDPVAEVVARARMELDEDLRYEREREFYETEDPEQDEDSQEEEPEV